MLGRRPSAVGDDGIGNCRQEKVNKPLVPRFEVCTQIDDSCNRAEYSGTIQIHEEASIGNNRTLFRTISRGTRINQL